MSTADARHDNTSRATHQTEPAGRVASGTGAASTHQPGGESLVAHGKEDTMVTHEHGLLPVHDPPRGRPLVIDWDDETRLIRSVN